MLCLVDLSSLLHSLLTQCMQCGVLSDGDDTDMSACTASDGIVTLHIQQKVINRAVQINDYLVD